MAEINSITCPVSAERINENVARTAAAYVILISVAAIMLDNYLLMALLGVDFALRAFTKGHASPVRFLALQTVSLLNIKNKPVDAAPKKFAAGVGMVFCAAIAALLFAGLLTAAWVTGAILLLCAILESAAGICIGCIVYTLLVVPFTKQRNTL